MKAKLLKVQDYDMAGLQVPGQLYLVLKEPAPLAGMAYPFPGMPWRLLSKAGISNVVCLCGYAVDYDPAPLQVLYAAELEDLHHGNSPADPEREEGVVRAAVSTINERLAKGEGVAVHCVGGTGRTGTVIGCVLRSMGYAADDVIRYLDELNKARGRRGWPEAPWQAGMVKKY